ncbi:KR domain-containing protein [Sesbania bispinosa]|nr:KR domain-containing protein [Sesbania bispinosa]
MSFRLTVGGGTIGCGWDPVSAKGGSAVEISLNNVVQEGGDDIVLLYEEAVEIRFYNVAAVVRRTWHGGRTGMSHVVQEGGDRNEGSEEAPRREEWEGKRTTLLPGRSSGWRFCASHDKEVVQHHGRLRRGMKVGVHLMGYRVRFHRRDKS